MFCWKCGTKLPDDAIFCHECGERVSGGNPSRQAASVQQTVAAQQAAPVQQTAPVQQAAPTQQTAPVQQAAPAQQTAPTRQTPEAPKKKSKLPLILGGLGLVAVAVAAVFVVMNSYVL